MLWKTLIKKAEQFVLNNPNHPNAVRIKVLAQSNKQKIWEYLRSIDVRHAGDLRQVLPEVFPTKLKRLPLKVSQNIHGAWRVDATNKAIDKETI